MLVCERCQEVPWPKIPPPPHTHTEPTGREMLNPPFRHLLLYHFLYQFFFFKLVYLLRGRQTEREGEHAAICLFMPPKACKGLPCWSGSHSSQETEPKPPSRWQQGNHVHHHHSLPVSAPAGSWSQDVGPEIKPRHFNMW